MKGSHVSSIDLQDDRLHLTYGSYKLELLYIWLRDHCRCNTCYNHKTNQKNVENYGLPWNLKPSNIDYNGMVLTLQWPNDQHITSYNMDWLIQNTFHDQHQDRVQQILWDKERLGAEPGLPLVPYKHYMSTDDGLKDHLTNLLKYGFSIVSEVPSNHEGTLEVSQRVCFIQETLFGPSWSFTSDLAYGDTAYTKIALGAHTDSTYFMSPSGIQVFHVLEHDGEGGQTLLVDGFHAAEKLRADNPDAFQYLTKTVVPHEYFDEGQRVRSLGTVLTLHPTTQRLINIRFNPYDRSPLSTLPSDDQLKFYKSYDLLVNNIKDPDSEFWIKLQPGMVLFVDNWRVLHGRAAFTGLRRVSGCYLPRDDWISRARTFNLLNL
ncbi:hypothetical protein FSP39_021529 [Pinctada imbricata]|uniref:Trimethyllysine dioxygenase, mitochondrial n=1 Tax=Pinctada imbricata TaxID=66713 RepID=A0AA88Y1M9_PINIB|nr:hypothetical protein FSP39_021529 [Pinctada imbricata]